MNRTVSFKPVDAVREYVPSLHGSSYEPARGEYLFVHTIVVDDAGKRRKFVTIPRDQALPIVFYFSVSAGTWIPIDSVSTKNGHCVPCASIISNTFEQFLGGRVLRGDTTMMERIHAFFPDFERLEWSAAIDTRRAELTTSTLACIEAGVFDRRGDFETSEQPLMHIELPAGVATFVQWIRDNGASHVLTTTPCPTVEVDECGRIRKFTVVPGTPPMLFYYSKTAALWAPVASVSPEHGECLGYACAYDSFQQFVEGRIVTGSRRCGRSPAAWRWPRASPSSSRRSGRGSAGPTMSLPTDGSWPASSSRPPLADG